MIVETVKTGRLHPTVVLLDISMPGMNGIEAAKRIRQVSPQSILVFVSENTDQDVIAAALQTGAAGYVLKRHMTAQLVAIIQMALGVPS